MNKVPELRFKEFSGEWEERNFEDLFEFHSTNSFSRANLNDIDGNVHNIHYGDIHKKFPTILDFDKAEVPFINNDIDLNKFDNECYCKNGDLIIADASEDYEDIGKAIELKNIGDKKILAGLHTFLAREKSNLTVDGFRGYVLLNNKIKLQIKKIATGISVLGISKTNLNKVVLNIPSLEEQEKIANFLSKVDEKIAILEDKLQLWETYKKGIMQQLFSQELRFKEDDGNSYPNWEEKKLGNICKIQMGQSPSSKNYTENPEDTILIQGNADLIKGRVVPRIFTTEITKTSKPNDIIMTVRAPVGDLAINEFNACIGRGVCSIKANEFIYHLLHHIKEKKLWAKFSQGSTIDAVSSKDIKNLRIKLPSLEEQEKIANFLTNIDEKTQKITNKLEINKKFKEGLLQKMFCQ